MGGGGIGHFVCAAADLLSRVAEVTIITTSLWEQRYHELRASNDPRLPDQSVRFAFVKEPNDEEAGGWYHVMHIYGSRLLARLRELYPDHGPELIEFPDFLGEGFVTLQAAETNDPLLADTCIAVRIHTTAEICEVLDGFSKCDLGSRALHAMERYCLAHADALLWQGGDILGLYGRFYGEEALASAQQIRYPYRGESVALDVDESREPTQPLKLLYAGRLERRKGVHNLIRALTGLERDDFSLTLLGADTPTAPLGVSMREHLELAIADDPRIHLGAAVGREELADAIRSHDLVAIPSLWECWPYAALEPMHLNRPVLATPVGGLAELVQPGRSGWLTRGTDAIALEEALAAVLDRRGEVDAMIRAGAPARHARTLVGEAEILEGYQALASVKRRRAPLRRGGQMPPLVSAIVPYYRASRFVRDTVESLLAQSYPALEIVLVNDGSFEPEDWAIAELSAQHPVVVVTQMNQGLGAARNFGIGQSRGRYVFPLDADNVAEPGFVARCVEVLERNPEIAYVTSWSRYIDEQGGAAKRPEIGYQPLGNHAEVNAQENVAGDAAALLRRRLFDAGFRYSEELTSFEDWHLYRELQNAGHFGAVIPERLLRYRLREDSLQAQFAQPKRRRLEGEISALIRENGLQWTSLSA